MIGGIIAVIAIVAILSVMGAVLTQSTISYFYETY